MMSERNLPHLYWAEAVSTAVYIMNRTPTAAVHDVTPEEKYTGKRQEVSHFKVFGCIAYVHIPNELRTCKTPPEDPPVPGRGGSLGRLHCRSLVA